MRDPQRYDLDPDPRSRSQGPEICKINQITTSVIASQNAPQNWDFATQSEISGANSYESIFSVSYLNKTNVNKDVC